jgi:hypothetical protein
LLPTLKAAMLVTIGSGKNCIGRIRYAPRPSVYDGRLHTGFWILLFFVQQADLMRPQRSPIKGKRDLIRAKVSLMTEKLALTRSRRQLINP